MKCLVIAVALLLAGFCRHASADEFRSFVKFDVHPRQSHEELHAHWEKLSPQTRRGIEDFLFTHGLSSTGRVQLIGVYFRVPKDEQTDNKSTIFHFQQLDLLGSRLFWSILIEPAAKSAQVLYHVQDDFVTGKPVAFQIDEGDDDQEK